MNTEVTVTLQHAVGALLVAFAVGAFLGHMLHQLDIKPSYPKRYRPKKRGRRW